MPTATRGDMRLRNPEATGPSESGSFTAGIVFASVLEPAAFALLGAVFAGSAASRRRRK